MCSRYTTGQPSAGLRRKRNVEIMTLQFPPRWRWSDMNDRCRGHRFVLRPAERNQTLGERHQLLFFYTNPWKGIDGGTREFHYQPGDRWWCFPFSRFCGKVKETAQSSAHVGEVWCGGQIRFKWYNRSVEKRRNWKMKLQHVGDAQSFCFYFSFCYLFKFFF